MWQITHVYSDTQPLQPNPTPAQVRERNEETAKLPIMEVIDLTPHSKLRYFPLYLLSINTEERNQRFKGPYDI